MHVAFIAAVRAENRHCFAAKLLDPGPSDTVNEAKPTVVSEKNSVRRQAGCRVEEREPGEKDGFFRAHGIRFVT